MSDCRCGGCGNGRALLLAAQLGIDCSDEGKADRDELFAAMRARIFGGYSAVSDRSRSVSMLRPGELWPLYNRLLQEKQLCDGHLPLPSRRTFYIPLIKGL